MLDKVSEIEKGENKIGSTLKGIGPTYMDKTGRNGIRIGDINNNLQDKYDILLEKHYNLIKGRVSPSQIDISNIIDERNKWNEAIEVLRSFDLIDSEYFINKALKATEDRIDFGDAQFDQRTGEIIKVPIKAHVALKISTELLAKQQKLDEKPIKEEVERTIDDRLLRLSEEFAKFASSHKITILDKTKTIDVQTVEIK